MDKILLAEDDYNLGTLLQEFLEQKGFHVTWAQDGEQAWDYFVAGQFDLCVFDVMMPKKDGFTLAKEVRLSGKDIPIIFLTAKSIKEDTLQGFKLGGDDYITKPFDQEELVLRIQAILRRYQRSNGLPIEEVSDYMIGLFTFNFNLKELTLNGEIQKLTSKESALLKLFCENKNQAVGRSYALKLIWGDDSYFNARSMDVYITKLRKHLRADPSIQIINLHGEGFKLLV